ncbi:dihydrolipoyllysine-residue acetyltransferase [Litoribacillus peritrichatus]|uniref:Dihydrolipoamide acetyltransferase component of pyruvate dehydrogenase complex n=1 Tax=Litoribacillus peritrichatus TaxID=718191 RepID=A0ABP7M1G7_9GAMM
MDEIKIPDLGGFQDIEIIEMPVAEGDAVEQDEALLVLETDKATMEVPAPSAGVIKRFNVKVGDKVNEGDVFASMEIQGQAQDSAEEMESSTVAGDAASSPQQVDSSSAHSGEAVQQAASDNVSYEQSIVVPDIGGASDVSVIEVSVSEGQSIDAEESLIVLETDKATMEVPSSVAGVVQTLAIKVGDKVNEGDLIAVVLVEGKESSLHQAANSAEDKSDEAEEKVKVQSVGADSNKDGSNHQSQALADEGKTLSTSSSIYAGPAVRKLAREFGVSLKDVLQLIGASGPKGRVLQEDIQGYVKKRLGESNDTQPSGAGIEPIPAVDFSRFGSVRREALSRIQKISAQHLHRCWLNVPHVTQFDEIDITELESFRKKVNQDGIYDVKLTLVPFLVKAVQKVLSEMPRFNASLAPEGDEIIIKEYYHIGVAVDTNQGLMVPVVKNVDTKSILNIASDCMHYAQQAREGKLKPDALQGSCFSISSLGGIGGTQFTPIVNAPEVAILGVSKASIKPVWADEGWQPRLILPIALSYDHRVIDGVLAAKFTTRLKQVLEDSRHLLL